MGGLQGAQQLLPRWELTTRGWSLALRKPLVHCLAKALEKVQVIVAEGKADHVWLLSWLVLELYGGSPVEIDEQAFRRRNQQDVPIVVGLLFFGVQVTVIYLYERLSSQQVLLDLLQDFRNRCGMVPGRCPVGKGKTNIL